MSTTEERAGFLPVPPSLPQPLPPAWTDRLVERYVRSLLRHHEAIVAAGDHNIFIMQTLERLLGIQHGVDGVRDTCP